MYSIDYRPILEDLNNHKHNREELMEQCIQQRLEKSLTSYYKEMCSSFNYLKYRDDIKVVKKLNE